MDFPDITLRGVLATAGSLAMGAVGTAALTIGLLTLVEPIRGAIYDAFYLAVGPWSATTAATVLSFTVAVLGALSVVTLLAASVSGTRERLRVLAVGLVGGIAVVLLLLVVATFLDANGLPTVLLVVGLFVAGVPLGLRRLDAWPWPVAAFAGGVPVVALSMLVLGFGLGWGGGYVVVAEEVPASSVSGPADADFDDYPQIRDALLSPSGDTAGWCEAGDAGRRVCYLELRGYDHEAQAAAFLADHGVRCPYRNAAPGSRPAGKESFVAVDDGTYYRVRCGAYGD